MNANLNFDSLFKQLPEQELWRLLQDVIASEVELADATIQQLDDPATDETTLCELLLAAGLSTSRPVRASAPGIDSIH
jgi:hypothetical protein